MTLIAHLTSVHTRFDTRIFLKECRALVRSGYKVALIVADGQGNEQRDGIDIYDVGRPRGRLDRIFNTTRRIGVKAISLDVEVYQLHDPELIPLALKLKRLGKKVIFDAHEDVPKQLLTKPYLARPFRKLISRIFERYEQWACRKIDAVVTATPFINDKFQKINSLSVNINNFPMLNELTHKEGGSKLTTNTVCYVGGITTIRGVVEIVQAMEILNGRARLLLGGTFSETELRTHVISLKGWDFVEELGWLKRDEIREVLNRSIAGLVTLHPTMNYIDALPVKMFEYMSAGVPVIASDFPLWRTIIVDNNCGVCVDPLDPQAIADAIAFLLQNPEKARLMGLNGKRAVIEQYNWEIEEIKLLDLYAKLVSD